MLHARKDYNKAVQDGGKLIGEDEPVFLLRAKDMLAPAALRYWARQLDAAAGDVGLVAKVRRWANKMEIWQEANGSKLPDTPADQFEEA